MINIFIGYDPREAIAYHVCTNSIIRRSSQPVALNPLALNALKGYDEKHTDGSNHFIYSRFLVPHLMNYKGWAIFIDGDMIVRDDINELWEMRDDTKAVMVVKHDYQTKMAEKYLGATGAQVHRFTWLTDDLIGELPKEWNWLDVEYDWNPHAKLVHYTLGTPCFHEFSDQGNFANEWHKERIYTEYCLQRGLNG